MNFHAQLDWADGQPVSSVFGDVYFSKASGLEETRHVFIQHNQLPGRFDALAEHSLFTIAETGFGTGLNLLCAWECFEHHAPASARLHFISAEKYPLTKADLTQALALWPTLQPFADRLLARYDNLPQGWHRLVLQEGRVYLTLMVGDVLDGYAELNHKVDAWFLDGFAPSKNPDMWQQPLFNHMARLSSPGTTFATFTSAGFVRRGLKEAGFGVSKVAGYGHKREMSCGTLETPVASQWQAPWFNRPAARQEKTALVIGAGIAGASTAASLASRGWAITVLERQHDVATEASGNPQGILYAKLSPHFTPLTRLVLSGYAYTLQTLQAALPQEESTWQACGVLHIAEDAATGKKQQELVEAGLPSSLLQTVTAEEANQLTGIDLNNPGLYFPQAGWLHPPALVRSLLSHAGITLKTNCDVARLEYNPERDNWSAYDANNQILGTAGSVIICTANQVTRLAQTAHLQVKPIRGQVTVTAATSASEALKTVLCGEGYISPARYHTHCMGATFKFNTDSLDVTREEHQENLDMLAGMAPALYQALDMEKQAAPDGRAAFRCTSPDYLPLIGPVMTEADFVDSYAALGKDATLKLTGTPHWQQGLYVNTAHGSRGMITAPLSGEVLAAYMDGELFPLSESLIQAIHPNRFLLRDLIRQKLKPAG